MKISKIILCGNSGNNAVFLEYNLPPNFVGDVTLNFGQGGVCRAWMSEKKPITYRENGFNEKKVLDILKNSVNIVSNNSVF